MGRVVQVMRLLPEYATSAERIAHIDTDIRAHRSRLVERFVALMHVAEAAGEGHRRVREGRVSGLAKDLGEGRGLLGEAVVEILDPV